MDKKPKWCPLTRRTLTHGKIVFTEMKFSPRKITTIFSLSKIWRVNTLHSPWAEYVSFVFGFISSSVFTVQTYFRTEGLYATRVRNIGLFSVLRFFCRSEPNGTRKTGPRQSPDLPRGSLSSIIASDGRRFHPYALSIVSTRATKIINILRFPGVVPRGECDGDDVFDCFRLSASSNNGQWSKRRRHEDEPVRRPPCQVSSAIRGDRVCGVLTRGCPRNCLDSERETVSSVLRWRLFVRFRTKRTSLSSSSTMTFIVVINYFPL